MALPTFIPFEMPSPGGFGWEDAAEIKEAKYENNYKQRVRIGLNAVGSKYNVRWDQCPKDRANELRAFFKERAGLPFLWAPPFETTPIQFTCDKWSFEAPYPMHGTFSATFDRDFGIY